MEPIDFKQSNMTLTAPGAMPDCGDLPVYTDGKQCVSCWKMSFKERIKVLFTGRVWLGVIGHRTQPPVWLNGNKPFIEPTIKDEVRAFFFNLAAFLREGGQTIKEIAKAIKNEPDKRKHCIAGMIMAFVAGMVAEILYGIRAGVFPGMAIGFASGFTVGSIVGILKEVYDKKSGKGTPERMDWYATIFGSFIGSSVASIIIMLILLLVW